MRAELSQYIKNYKDHVYGFDNYKPWFDEDPLWYKKLMCCAQELDKRLRRYTYTGAARESREIAVILSWGTGYPNYDVDKDINLFGIDSYAIVKRWGLELVAVWSCQKNTVMLVFGIPKKSRRKR